MKRENADETDDALFREAVRYLQLCLLADLRPPWAAHKFAQALPGEGMLARFTNPLFLSWTRADAELLFRSEVMSTLRNAALSVDREVDGVLGRPLYVCTAQPLAAFPGRLCLATAAMSPLIQLPEKWKHYLCANCQQQKHECTSL